MTCPSSPGAGATLKPKVWWPAVQVLSWIIMGVPLGKRNWDGKKMGPMLVRAQIELARAIGAGRVKALGRPARHALYELIPSEQFCIPDLVLVVGFFGELATIPPQKINTYEGLSWSDINKFDPDEIKQVFAQPLLGPQPKEPGGHEEPPPDPQPPDPAARDVVQEATPAANRSSTATKSKGPKRQSYWSDDVERAIKDLFPDDNAREFDGGVVVDKVLAALASKIERSPRNPPGRGLILRKTGHWAR